MICSHCGAQNPDDARKCVQCGELLGSEGASAEPKKSSASSRIRKITVESVDSRDGFGKRKKTKNIPEGTLEPLSGSAHNGRGPSVEDTLDLSKFHLEDVELKEVNLEDSDFSEEGPETWGPFSGPENIPENEGSPEEPEAFEDMEVLPGDSGKDRPARRRRGIFPAVVVIAVVLIIAAAVAGVLIWRHSRNNYADVILEGNRYYREADYEKARDLYYRALEMDPENPEGYFCLADVYVALDETGNAVNILSEGYTRTGDAQLEQRIRELSGDNGESRPEDSDASQPESGETAGTGTAGETQMPETQGEGEQASAGSVRWALEPGLEAADIMPVPGCSPQEDVWSGSVSMLIRDGQAGLIDGAGNIVLEPQFQYILKCSGLLYGFRDDGSSVRINEDYTLNTEAAHDHEAVSRDYLWDEEQEAVFCIVHTSEGTVVEETPLEIPEGALVPVIAGTAESYSLEDARYGLATSKGLCTEFVYEDTGAVSHDGMMAVCLGGKWGFCDLNGVLVVPCEYDGAKYLGPVNTGEESGYIQGAPYGYSGGYAAIKKDGKWGFLDTGGDVAVPFIFEEARPVQDGEAWVRYEGKWGRVLVGAQEAPEEDAAAQDTATESGASGQPESQAADTPQQEDTAS